MLTDAVTTKDITILDLDHPGAKDPAYRRRRNYLASLAIHCREHDLEPAFVEYTEEEHSTWRFVAEKLGVAHERFASREHLSSRRRLGIPVDRIPQLRELSQKLERLHGFRLRAIEGLVDPKTFLSGLADRVMWCTQYIRHSSKPEYTPEPDIVHEVIGHVPMFANEDFVALSIAIGRAAAEANPNQIALLDRLYWYTLEFGLIEEPAGVRAYGAGLLSSFGELEYAFTDDVEHRPFDTEEVVLTPYAYSRMQPLLFVIPSFAYLKNEVDEWLSTELYLAS